MSPALIPPRVVICGIAASGWFESRLSLRAWAIHGRRICACCEIVTVHVVGDLA